MPISVLKFQHNLGKSKKEFSATTRHIGLVLATFADKVSGHNAYPSIRTLQERSGRSRPTVIHALRQLEAGGWITIQERQGRGRGWRHRRYSLDVPVSWRGKPTLPRQRGHSLYIKHNRFLNQRSGDKSPSKPTQAGNNGAAGHWRNVLEAIRRVGRYRTPDLQTEVMDAIRKIGGWGSLCGALESDLRPGGPIYQKFAACL